MVIMFTDKPPNYDLHGVCYVFFIKHTVHVRFTGEQHTSKFSLAEVAGIVDEDVYRTQFANR